MCNSNLNSNPCNQICKRLVAYEKAIEAYQFHVQRYHTWVNYYAIFVGALFVAFYTVVSQIENIRCNPCCDSGIFFSMWLPLLIMTLGWFTSICWLASIIGHYKWMNSWILIVKEREKLFFGTSSNQQADGSPDSSDTFVYGKVMSKDEKTNNEGNSGTNDETNSEVNNNPNNEINNSTDNANNKLGIFPKFISTQKVTQRFVWSVILAWIAGSCFFCYIASIVYSVLTVIIGICLYKKPCKWYSSKYLVVIQAK